MSERKLTERELTERELQYNRDYHKNIRRPMTLANRARGCGNLPNMRR